MNRAVFIDRDNTIIQADQDVSDPRQVRLIQGAASAIASLRGLGYKTVVVSNQGGVAHGAFTEADVDAVHARIAALVEQNSGGIIDAFYYCPYHPEGAMEEYRREHPWRKPQPGMLHQAAEDLNLDLAACWMVGDRRCDVEAGLAVGARTVLLRDAASGAHEPPPPGVEADFTARNLIEAARVIAQQPRADRPLRRAAEQAAKTAAGPRMEATYTEADSSAAAEGDDATDIQAEGTPSPVSTKPSAAHSPRRSARPFRPWDVEPAATDSHEAESPTSTEPADKPGATPTQTNAPPESAEPREVADSDEPPHLPADEAVVDLLRQIHRELRSRHAAYGDFSFNKMLAGVFQMLVVGCVLLGLFNVSEPTLFFQWISGGVLGQLLVITLLIAHGQR